MKVSPGVSVFRHAKCSLAPKKILMLVVTLQSALQVSFRPAGESELTEEHGEHDGHEGELDARVPQLYSRTHRRCREWENVVWDGSSCHALRCEPIALVCRLRDGKTLAFVGRREPRADPNLVHRWNGGACETDPEFLQ